MFETSPPENFEVLVSELSADFVAMPVEAIDAGIESWLERIVRALRLERSALAQISDDGQLLVRTHAFTAPGYPSLPEYIRTENELPWLGRQIRAGRTIVVSKLEDLPAEAAQERQFMQSKAGPKSNVMLPLKVGGNVIGLITFASLSREREWSQDLVKRLELIAGIIGNALMRKRKERQIGSLLRFEQLLSRISATFVRLPAEDIDGALTDSLQEVVEFLGIDRGTIVSFSADRAVLYRTHWHAIADIEPMPATLGTDHAWTFGQLRQGQPVVVSRVADLPAEAALEREYLERVGVRSTVAIPLFLGDAMLGAAIFSALREEIRWPEALVQRLQLLGGVLASALGRKAMEEVQRETLRFEQLIANVSARLAAVVPDRAGEEITRALGEILQFFGADHCSLTEGDLVKGDAHIRYLASGPGIASLPTDIDYASECPLTYDRLFRQSETLVRSRMGDYPAEDSIDREMVEVFGIRAILAIPIAVGERLRYCLGLGSSRENIVWPEEYVPRLRMLGDALVNALLRTRSDEALRTSEERFRRVVESAPNGVMMVDADGRIVLANPQLERMFGYGHGELLGSHVETLVPLRDRERHLAYRREYLADAEIRQMGSGRELYGLRKDGGEIPVEIGLNPMGTSEGRFVLATIVDATERKRAETALRDSARSLAEAQQIARLGSWEWDVVAQKVQLSDEAQRIVGAEMAKSSDFIAIAHPQDRSELAEAMARLWREQQGPVDLEFRIVPPDGGQRIVRVRGQSYFGQDGSPLRAVGTIQDVSEVRQAEAETRELRTQLWHIDRVARSGTLTASLAHELNQPLTAILSNAQAGLRFLARGNPDIAELREILGDIARDDKRAAAVISGLRAMMRHRETERESVEMAGVLTEVLGLLHSELIGAGIELKADFEQGCCVLADRVQLQQVVLNLVMNAVEAMRDSHAQERRISVACGGAGAAVQVRVQDTGPGISPERRESVFDAFATTKPEGMGLGLAVCRSIIESHGGTIRVEAGDGGHGSRFIFEIPAAADTSADDVNNGEGVAR
ncbi:MAG: PAS domain S-box protein [Gammaproteobacteria bacterium]